MNCKTEKCGFFLGPTDTKYGSSLDVLGLLGILLKVKTRAEESSGLLESLEKFPHYFVECQLQMLCTGAEFCILQSYHLESKTSKLFIIKYNNALMIIIKEIVDCIFDENHMLDWDHTEIVQLQTFAKQILGKVLNCELLLPLRGIKNCKKLVPLVEFLDGFGFVLERHNEINKF